MPSFKNRTYMMSYPFLKFNITIFNSSDFIANHTAVIICYNNLF